MGGIVIVFEVVVIGLDEVVTVVVVESVVSDAIVSEVVNVVVSVAVSYTHLTLPTTSRV